MSSTENGMRSLSKPLTGSHRFATLEIVNEAGRKSASFLGQNPDRISDNHRSRMRVVQIGILFSIHRHDRSSFE